MFSPLLLVILTSTCVTYAIKINGEDVSIDEAICRASAHGGSQSLLKDSETVLVELDILYKIDTYIKLKTENDGTWRVKRQAVLPESWYRWTDNRIPYEISSDFSPDEHQIIMDAIKEYHKYTCLRFEPASPNDSDRVRFQDGDNCESYVGMVGGTQRISLGFGCRYRGIVIHEIGHAIGFQHEQTRPDRDEYVQIETQNIIPDMEYNFDKFNTAHVSTYGVSYDYTSVMHYGQYAFTKNGKPTIIANDPSYQSVMGNREGLSYRDIKLANLMYHCAASQGCEERKCPKGAFQGKDCKCWCKTESRQNPVKHCDSTPFDLSGKTVTDCEDKVRICTSWKKYCKLDSFKHYLMRNCRKTCGYC